MYCRVYLTFFKEEFGFRDFIWATAVVVRDNTLSIGSSF